MASYMNELRSRNATARSRTRTGMTLFMQMMPVNILVMKTHATMDCPSFIGGIQINVNDTKNDVQNGQNTDSSTVVTNIAHLRVVGASEHGDELRFQRASVTVDAES